MNSMERAPEPTMEEILASIRRIIADDESGSARQERAAQPAQPADELEASEGEADDKIISDIARVLSGTAQTPQEEEEDILDLTSELGGMEIAEEQIVLEEVVAEDQPSAEIVAPEAFQPAPEAPAEIEAFLEPDVEPGLETAMEALAEEEPSPAQPEVAPSPMTASEEAASALERAIAALRAGQLPTSFAELTAASQPEPQAEAPIYGEASGYSAPEPEPAPSFEAASEPQAEPESEGELVLAEFETVAIAEETAEPAADASEAEARPVWESEAEPSESFQEPALEAAPLTNGHNAEPDGGDRKSLEDSVKDMLRPMLQRWLDENMTRVLTAALQDELKNNPARFQRD